ncbi:hypothetical protein BDK51DRAFT_44309 [Blyttiomyces helicus]|uniref:Uncharacterized protein n=1 Tax=Blyttiomyces helicus TaxID=388810 RepID=A0A4P9WMC5_9FUNG|nr:hypothetical protein BDK51DRAFT_44309 [Blyttiomyces helicus]|eukprot:RKO93622.1 hypothetical protein BDK51DRAFT_44309 [Blyttiomyces helicus]
MQQGPSSTCESSSATAIVNRLNNLVQGSSYGCQYSSSEVDATSIGSTSIAQSSGQFITSPVQQGSVEFIRAASPGPQPTRAATTCRSTGTSSERSLSGSATVQPVSSTAGQRSSSCSTTERHPYPRSTTGELPIIIDTVKYSTNRITMTVTTSSFINREESNVISSKITRQVQQQSAR